MRKGGGKAKGAEFERWVCKQLSLAISNNKRDDIFWRSAMSGGRATIKFKKGEENIAQVGDISGIDSIGSKFLERYVIECKRYRIVHLESLFYGKPKKDSVLEFWKQVEKDADNCNKEPILIVKENGKDPLVFVEDDFGTGQIYIDGLGVYVIYFKDFLNQYVVAFAKSDWRNFE
tara:strand:- start:10006 stop:10530 length:525 start_codon:yes stop_codon:yes gene_type:complete